MDQEEEVRIGQWEQSNTTKEDSFLDADITLDEIDLAINRLSGI